MKLSLNHSHFNYFLFPQRPMKIEKLDKSSKWYVYKKSSIDSIELFSDILLNFLKFEIWIFIVSKPFYNRGHWRRHGLLKGDIFGTF